MIIPPALSDKQKEEAVRDHYQSIRTNVLLSWVLTNVCRAVASLSCPRTVLTRRNPQALLVAVILEGDYASTFSEGGGNGRTQVCA